MSIQTKGGTVAVLCLMRETQWAMLRTEMSPFRQTRQRLQMRAKASESNVLTFGF